MKKKKDYLIYAFYDRMGVIDFHVIESLKNYNLFFSIIFVSNVKINKKEIRKIDFVEKIIVSEHKEMDFGSWKLGLNFLKSKRYENILLVNDSIIGPVKGIKNILDTMKNKKCDFWGITSAGIDKNYHLQSYFLFLKKKCIQSLFFKNFFSQVKKLESKRELVKKYEIGLTQGLIANGMHCRSLLSEFKRDIHSQEECINLFLKKKLPFFKVKNIVSNPYRIRGINRIFNLLKPREKYLNYVKRINNSDSLIHLNFLIPQFKKFFFSKRILLIRSKIVLNNSIWRFYIKVFGVYIFFFLLPITKNFNKLYKSDSNYKD